MKMRSLRLLTCLIAALLTTLTYAQEETPNPEQMESFLRARIAADKGDSETALALLDALITENENAVLYYERARIHLEERNFREAERDLRNSIRLDASLSDSRKTLGRLLLDRSRNDGSRIDEALEHLTVAYQLNPNDIGTGLMIAQVYNGTGRPERAIQVLDGLIERMPDNRSVNHQYAQVLLQQGREVEAIPHLEVVATGDPFYEPAAAQLIDLYEKTNDWEGSVDLLERWVHHDPANIELRKRLGFAQLRAGEPEEAVETLEWVMRQVTGDPRLDYLYAEALSAASRFQEAQSYYESLLERDPSNIDLLVSYALNELRLEKFDSASRRFRAIVRRPDVSQPVRALALSQLAAIAHHEERWDEALEYAGRAIEAGAESPQALGITLDVYRRQESYGEALDLIERRLGESPDDAMLMARRLQFQRLAERNRAAQRTLSELLERDRDSALLAVQVLGQLEHWSDAVEAGRKALQLWGDEDVSLLFQLGASLERSGEYDEAVAAFRKLLRIDSDHAPSQNYLGYMWADKGENLESALELIRKAVDADPRNGAYADSLGWVHYRLGNLELAEKHLSEAADLEPNDPTIQEHLGDVHALLGRLDLARKHYEEALALEPENPGELKSKLSDIEERLARADGEAN